MQSVDKNILTYAKKLVQTAQLGNQYAVARELNSGLSYN